MKPKKPRAWTKESVGFLIYEPTHGLPKAVITYYGSSVDLVPDEARRVAKSLLQFADWEEANEAKKKTS